MQNIKEKTKQLIACHFQEKVKELKQTFYFISLLIVFKVLVSTSTDSV